MVKQFHEGPENFCLKIRIIDHMGIFCFWYLCISAKLMKRTRYHITRIALLLMAGSLLSGCFLFRKKNRCGDCPKWHKIELPSLQNTLF
jgi:hypothetical protein